MTTAPLWRVLRGSRVSNRLAVLGVNPRQYWLLIDLFWQLSERREMFGRTDSATLQVISLVYFALTAIMSLVIGMKAEIFGFLTVFMLLTAFLLFTILIAEAGNTLVNPRESAVLAHQPINGATYTAAKLSHLLRIVAYLVFGMNSFPAVVGIFVRGGTWAYPFLHLSLAFAVGLAAALVCCGIYGWLIRLFPPNRLKTVSQMADAAPFLMMVLFQSASSASPVIGSFWAATGGRTRAAVLSTGAAGLLLFVVVGLKSLSADYMVLALSIAGGRSGARTALRRSLIGPLIARWCGGPPGRAGYEYLRRMMVRDWQFKKQLMLVAFWMLWSLVGVVRYGRRSPFDPQFSTAHLFPYCVSALAFMICGVLLYGADYKAAWIFRTVTPAVLKPFANGCYATLAWWIVVAPHLTLLPFACPAWGLWRALLFVAFSAAMVANFLALEIRMIEYVPFTRQFEPKRGMTAIPVMIGGAFVMGLLVLLQHYVLFRHAALVAVATAALAISGFILTRASLNKVTANMRFQLSMDARESAGLYVEVG